MAEIRAILIDPRDNVATLTADAAAGDAVAWDGSGRAVTAAERIPAYHKIALADIPKGGTVYKYGQYIGRALRAIRAGEHVHTHNMG